MRTRHFLSVVTLAAAVLLQGCAGGFLGLGGGPKIRPANMEVRILSQSCFQGEVIPCG